MRSAEALGLNITDYPETMAEAVSLLDKGEVVGIYTFKPFGVNYLQGIKRNDLYVAAIRFSMVSLGFFFNDNKINLLRRVNMSILKMTVNGEKELICNQYDHDRIDASDHCL